MDLMLFMETMGNNDIPLIAAFFIGLMMAISPCPLATNITAIAYISKKLENKKTTLWIGLVYTLGRMLVYVALASLIVWFGINTQFISSGIQKYGEKILGPFLILIGIIMLDLINMHIFHGNFNLEKLKEKLAKNQFIGSFFLGALFALAFCPFSAVLFFGMLIPLAIKTGDGIIIPAVFAFATGLPVIIFSFILVYSVSKLSRIMNKVSVFEKWTRYAVSVTFIIVGIYYLLRINFGIL